MSISSSLIKNTTARTITEVFNRTSSAVFWVIIARHLGASGLGILAFGLSLFSLFNTLASFGLGAVITRDISKQKHKCAKYFGTSLMLGSTSSILFALMMIFVGFLISPDVTTFRVVIIFSTSLLPVSIFFWSKTVLSAFEKMESVAYANIAENLLRIVLGVWAVARGMGVETIALVILSSRISSAILCFFYAGKRTKWPVFKWDNTLIRSLLRQVPIFASTSLFNSLFWSATVIILTHFQGAEDAGIFSAAFKIVDTCLAITFAYGQALFPIVSRISNQMPKLFEQLCRKSVKYMTVFTLAVSVIITMLSDKIIHLVYGNSLQGATKALSLQIWALVPFGVVPIFAYSLISRYNQKQDMIANAAAAISLIILNLILVPKYGSMGASIAFVSGCLIFFVWEFHFVDTKLFRFRLQTVTLKLFSATLIFVMFGMLLKGLDVWLAIPISAVIYLTVLISTRVISKYDLQFYQMLRSI